MRQTARELVEELLRFGQDEAAVREIFCYLHDIALPGSELLICEVCYQLVTKTPVTTSLHVNHADNLAPCTEDMFVSHYRKIAVANDERIGAAVIAFLIRMHKPGFTILH